MNSRAGLWQTFSVSNVEFRNFFSDRSKLYGLVMSSESVFENIYKGTGFSNLEILQWRSTEIQRFEVPWNFFTVNISLHFLQLTIKNYLFRQLTVTFRPFDGWRLTFLRQPPSPPPPHIGLGNLYHRIFNRLSQFWAGEYSLPADYHTSFNWEECWNKQKYAHNIPEI